MKKKTLMSVNQYLKPISEGQDSGGIKAGKGIKADDEASKNASIITRVVSVIAEVDLDQILQITIIWTHSVTQTADTRTECLHRGLWLLFVSSPTHSVPLLLFLQWHCDYMLTQHLHDDQHLRRCIAEKHFPFVFWQHSRAGTLENVTIGLACPLVPLNFFKTLKGSLKISGQGPLCHSLENKKNPTGLL